MPGKDTKQHQPLPWPRREILVRDLLAQVCEIHRHQLALKELREIREARGSKVARELRQSGFELPSNTFAGFVLEQSIGRYGAPLPRGLRKLASGSAYAHATALMLRDQDRFIYCEGYALPGGLASAAEHAWVLDRQNGDQVVDNTWLRPEAAVYLGVPLAPEFVRKFMKPGQRMIGDFYAFKLTSASEAYWLFPNAAALARDFTARSMT